MNPTRRLDLDFVVVLDTQTAENLFPNDEDGNALPLNEALLRKGIEGELKNAKLKMTIESVRWVQQANLFDDFRWVPEGVRADLVEVPPSPEEVLVPNVAVAFIVGEYEGQRVEVANAVRVQL